MHANKIQEILNVLYTQAKAREQFVSNREAFCFRYEIKDKETIGFFNELKPEQLTFFANGLLAKRRNAVKDLLPTTTHLLGKKFNAHFTSFAEDHLPTGIHKHHEDAISFCNYLSGSAEHMTTEFSNIMSFEKLQIINFLSPIKLMFKAYKINPIRIQQQTRSGIPSIELTKCRTIIIWKNGKYKILWSTK